MNNLQLKNAFERLKIELRKVRYAALSTLAEDENGQQMLYQGKPFAFLPIIHHCLLTFSPAVAEYITKTGGFDMYAKSDLRFMESVYQLLIAEFNFKPTLSVHQFFQDGFAEHKLNLCSEVARLMREKHEVLQKQQTKPQSAVNSYRPVENEPKEDPKFRVVRHTAEAHPLSMHTFPETQEHFPSSSLPSMFPAKQPVPQQQIPFPTQKPSLNPQTGVEPSSVQIVREIARQTQPAGNQTGEIMNLLMTLNESVRALGSRFDAYQRSTEDKFNKVTAEMCLLRNRVDMLEANNFSQARKQYEQPPQSTLSRLEQERDSSNKMLGSLKSQSTSLSEPDDAYIKRIQERYAETKALLSHINK